MKVCARCAALGGCVCLSAEELQKKPCCYSGPQRSCVAETGFLSDGCRRERRHEGKSFQITGQAWLDKSALTHKKHAFFFFFLIFSDTWHWFCNCLPAVQVVQAAFPHSCPVIQLVLRALLFTFLFQKKAGAPWTALWAVDFAAGVRWNEEWASAGLLLRGCFCLAPMGLAGAWGWICLLPKLSGVSSVSRVGTFLQFSWLAGTCEQCLPALL